MNNVFTRARLQAEGFEGFVPVSALRRSGTKIPVHLRDLRHLPGIPRPS